MVQNLVTGLGKVLPLAQQRLVGFAVAAGCRVIDDAELALLVAIMRIFQPDDVNVPTLAALPDEIERLRHFLSGVGKTRRHARRKPPAMRHQGSVAASIRWSCRR